MATRFTGGSIEVKLAGKLNESHPVAEPDTPFCVAVIGDFSGRGNREVETGGVLRNRRAYSIDRDNFSQVIAQLNVALDLPIFGKNSPPVTLHIADLDDFHPDRLFDNLEIFTPFKEIRHGLQDAAAFVAALGRGRRHRLEALEDVALGAAGLVDRHDPQTVPATQRPADCGAPPRAPRAVL